MMCVIVYKLCILLNEYCIVGTLLYCWYIFVSYRWYIFVLYPWVQLIDVDRWEQLILIAPLKLHLKISSITTVDCSIVWIIK